MRGKLRKIFDEKVKEFREIVGEKKVTRSQILEEMTDREFELLKLAGGMPVFDEVMASLGIVEPADDDQGNE